VFRHERLKDIIYYIVNIRRGGCRGDSLVYDDDHTRVHILYIYMHRRAKSLIFSSICADKMLLLCSPKV